MKIVFLDVKSIGEDIDLSGFSSLGEVVRYDFTSSAQAPERVKDADVIILNKVQVNASTIGGASHLKLVCVTGTGTNNLDKEYLESHKIAWRNVAGYSTESVAQHTFAMLFYLMEHLSYYEDYVKSGDYINDTIFSHFSQTFHQLHGQTWGIIGLGNIGRRVADIASLFGAKVIYYSASGQKSQEGYHQVAFDELLSSSDILSIHAPLNKATEKLIDARAFSKMKKNCIFLNLGRGPIVCEEALADALNQNLIQAAGIDVLCQEPMSPDCPLLTVRDKNRLLITPHIGWASVESRTNLMKIIQTQIETFFCTAL